MAELEAGVHWHAKSVELHPTAEPADKMQVCWEESQLNFDKQRSMGTHSTAWDCGSDSCTSALCRSSRGQTKNDDRAKDLHDCDFLSVTTVVWISEFGRSKTSVDGERLQKQKVRASAFK
jgi:hypothetical protein